MKRGQIGAKSQEGQLKPVRVVIIGIILVCLLIGFYYYLSHKTEGGGRKEAETITQTRQVLMRNLETNYPPSPKEVVKYYCEITQCFYNEPHTDEELEELALQIQKLYDDELVANQTQEEYLQNLISDIAVMKEQELVISSFSTSASTDVEEFTEDGYEWARLYCNFSIRQATTMLSSNEQFLLRKDEDGHWKIFGWGLVEE